MNTQCQKIAPVFLGPTEIGEVWSSAMGEQAQAAFLEEFDVESDIEDDSEATYSNSGGESEYKHNDEVFAEPVICKLSFLFTFVVASKISCKKTQ